MKVEYLYDIDSGWIALGMFILFVAITEIAFRFGRTTRLTAEVGPSHFNTLLGSIIGVLALLLGFSFAMSSNRFDARDHLAVEESNAVGKLYLRADFLPPMPRAEFKRRVREYVDLRLKHRDIAYNAEHAREVETECRRLHAELWSIVRTVLETKEPGELDALLVESLNDVIDHHDTRSAATRQHIPEEILLLLAGVAGFSFAFTGFGCGIAGRRHAFLTTGVVILVVSVITIIIDLDRPHRGVFQINQDGMIALQDRMSKER